MCKFVQIKKEHIKYIEPLYKKFRCYLEDDYSEDTLAGVINRTAPFFWSIFTHIDNQFAGFVYLDNIIGSKKHLHSAELTTCFHPDFWGDFSKYAAKIFLKKCFDEFGLTKIKGLIYPQNYRVKNLLKSSGFEKEAELKAETMRSGKLQNIEIYSLFKTYYEVKNEN